MADNQSIVTLNIGSQRIGMAVFEAAKNGGLVLKAYDSTKISADPAMEVARASQVNAAIAELVKKLKVDKTKARYAISGQSVLTRFVKLPPIDQDNVEQLVTFEATSQLPFPLNEVVWDYELVDSGNDKEALIVAIKTDALDEINDGVNHAGLGTMEVDVAPLAVYNAFRATYGHPEESILIIDMGAKSSNLIYTEGKRFFTRSINIGGTAITSAIAKEYGTSFDEAEQTKITSGLVALGGGHTEQLEESVAALAMIIRDSLTRLPAEISRTNNYYRSQHGGTAPQRVLLCGGGANLPYMLEFLHEKLGIPVEYFNPVQNVSMGKSVDSAVVQREGHLMGELVGLALRSVGKSEINIDLVPGVVDKQRAADRRKPFFIGAAALLVGATFLWALFQMLAAGKADTKQEELAEVQTNLAPKVAQVKSLLKKESDTRAIADGYTNLEDSQTFWLGALAEVRGAFASDAVWLTDFEPLVDYDITAVTGRANDKPTGKSLIKADFEKAKYGDSSVVATKEESAPAPTAKKGRPPVAPQGPMINAVRIKGFWRANDRDAAVLNTLLDRLKEKSDYFALTTNEGGKEQAIEDIRLLIRDATFKEGEAAATFTVTLPLRNPVAAQ